MKKEDFYFDSRDGQSKIHAVRYTPDTENILGVVQIVHGMAEYVERYEEFAEFLTARGFIVTGDDHLGHGKTVPQGGTYGYFCEQDPATVVVRDVHRLKKMTQNLYPNVPYIIIGHSMGSFILRNYLCRYGTGISGAVIMGTGMQSPSSVKLGLAVAAIQKVFCGSKHVSKFIDKGSFGSYNRKFEPCRTEVDWLCGNEETVDAYIKDPMCGFTFTVNGFQTLFQLVSRIQKKENLEKVPKTLPVFMVSGEDDPVGEYGKGVQRAYESLKAVGLENIKLKLYEKGRHELLNEVNRDVIMQDIYDWIKGTIIV